MSHGFNSSKATAETSCKDVKSHERQIHTSAEWAKLPNLPQKSRYVGATLDSHRLIVVEVGTFSECSVFLYDNRLPFSWQSLPTSPVRNLTDAAAVDGKLVVIGKKSPRGEKDTNEVHMLDLDNMKWSQLPSPKNFRDCSSIVFLEGYLYAFGGYQYIYHPWAGLGYGRSTTALSSAERLNMKTMKWEDIPPMSTERGYCAVTSVKDKIFVIGGSQHEWGSGMDLVEIFDTKLLRWSTGPPMPIKAFACAAVSLGENVIITGGMKSFRANESLGTTQVYDSTSKVWRVTASHMTTPRAWHAAGLLGRGQLLVSGGEKVCGATHKCYSPKLFNTVEVIILRSGWETLGPMIMLRWLVSQNRAVYDNGTGVECKSDNVASNLLSARCPDDVFKMVCAFL
eukprot:CAMPEP_0183318674 /NCGR_PEP_ID=MMETSP0160_2-20130417/61404_1 /TAXON_ID=2839 ORGANISM="Odontella Sinensis, Strain Grunow 1884" /NCGR_SAMPLE_ID=MMETSP0160_2 /ASSEMBLY_ACC=CAM_ASM_000250 /LENGTH=396 /DNA_ID=CAMNT_0025484999 /DNA_START=45 /DNA_END=1235 /DNA_ORIENTATION=+